MNQIKFWLSQLPKAIVGPVIVLIGVGFFVLSDPPKTVCDSQFEIFKESQKKYIFGYEKKKIKLSPEFNEHFTRCRDNNSLGGCYELFARLKGLLKSTRLIPSECKSRIKELKPLGQNFKDVMWLFAYISWDNGKYLHPEQYSWLEASEIFLYCRYQNEYRRLLGEEVFRKQQEALLTELVKKKKLNDLPIERKEAWRRTIISRRCP